jgi:hypothetical protein
VSEVGYQALPGKLSCKLNNLSILFRKNPQTIKKKKKITSYILDINCFNNNLKFVSHCKKIILKINK